MARPQDEVLEHGVRKRMFGCLWRVLCDSHGPARWTRSRVHVVVALRHHVGVGGAARARILVVTLDIRQANRGFVKLFNIPRKRHRRCVHFTSRVYSHHHNNLRPLFQQGLDKHPLLSPWSEIAMTSLPCPDPADVELTKATAPTLAVDEVD